MADLDYSELNRIQRYTQWVTFKAIPGALGTERTAIIGEAQDFFKKLADEGLVEVRGIYDISGMRAEADLMIWWHAEEFDQIQDAFQRLRRDTVLGQSLEVYWIGNAVHRPAEFNKRHLPSFVMGEEPQKWITVYPFVRSYDWYIMDAAKRSKILRGHGQAAGDFEAVRANTVPAFALGDFEWMLAFEGPDLGQIVDLMYKMRYTEARLYVREEIPFFTGRRVDDVAEAIKLLP